MIKFDVTNRFSGSVQFTAEIDCNEDAETSVQLGLSVKWAIINKAYLMGAYLRGAYLGGANLRGADLRGADLVGADLEGANLRGADLRGADLVGADLEGAYLVGADLRGADLEGAYLGGADLRGAYLRGADLRGADLMGADNADLPIAQTVILPEGKLIGWKKLNKDLIAKISIPERAKRLNASGRKCRAEYAKVLEIWNGDKQVKEGFSQHDNSFKYEVGKIVKPIVPFCENRWDECSSGIHFFITRVEAERY